MFFFPSKPGTNESLNTGCTVCKYLPSNELVLFMFIVIMGLQNVLILGFIVHFTESLQMRRTAIYKMSAVDVAFE